MNESHGPRDGGAGDGATGGRREDWSSTSPSTAVVEAVAEAAGRDPAALDPLYDAIDPDALDGLFRPGWTATPPDLRLSFTYASHEVTVGPAGALRVRPVQERVEAE